MNNTDGSDGSFILKCSRNSCTDCHSSLTNLPSYQSAWVFLPFALLYQHLTLWEFLMVAILMRVRWNLDVITFLIVLADLQNIGFSMIFYMYISLYFATILSSISLPQSSSSSLPSSLWIIPQSLLCLPSCHTHIHTHMHTCMLSLTHMYILI